MAFARLQGLLELQKVQRSMRLESGWDRDLEKLRKVVEVTVGYCRGEGWPTTLGPCNLSLLVFLAACKLCRERADQSKSLQSLSSARLALQGVLNRAKVCVCAAASDFIPSFNCSWPHEAEHGRRTELESLGVRLLGNTGGS